MASIELVKGSDGSGNASVATVQSSRAALASTIIVDTVLGINPAGFAGSMGTPHTFTDPITSETITVISEATAVDFTGHVDGSNLEIDDIAPGYTDAGSEVGDIVIIRPTTQWSDNVAEVLEVAHADDGNIATDTIAEKTPAAGVTVDGMKVKDSYVVGSATSGIKNASLGTEAGGLGAAWQAWTPTLTNITNTNGTLNCVYIQIGKTVHFSFKFTLGSSSAVGTDPQFTLPTTPLSTTYAFATRPTIGNAQFYDSGSGYIGYVVLFAAATAQFQAVTTGNPTGSFATVTATAPFTWATADILQAIGTYETT